MTRHSCPSLIAAAEKGKQAVCMVELKARFDERRNIHWSRALEEAGAHVVHGIPGLKTHAKAILIVRRERGTVRHYVMIGTGNFHAKQRPALRGLRLLHHRSSDRPGGRQPVQHADRLRPPRAAAQDAGGADLAARAADAGDRAHRPGLRRR